MMVVLKTGPFLHDNDDVLSFVTSLQLVLTFLGGLVLQMDMGKNGESMQHFDQTFIGYFLIAINVLCLILMVFSLVAAVAPMVKEYCCKKKNPNNNTKVNPEKGDEGGGEAGSGETNDDGVVTWTTGFRAEEVDKKKQKNVGEDDESWKNWM